MNIPKETVFQKEDSYDNNSSFLNRNKFSVSVDVKKYAII